MCLCFAKTPRKISDGITSTLNTIRSSIQADINSANQVISTALKAINSVTSIVNVNLSVPTFTIPSLNALANVTIPTGFEDDLKRLNQSIPTLDEFRTIVKDIIEVPFEKLKGEMNETFEALLDKITVDALPTLSAGGKGNPTTTMTSTSLISLADGPGGTAPATTFDLCGQMDTSFLDDIDTSLTRLTRIATGLLVLAFLLLWLAMIAWEWFTFKRMQEQAGLMEEIVERQVRQGRKVDGLRLVQMVEYPVVEKYGGMVVKKVTRTDETNDNLRWFCESFCVKSPCNSRTPANHLPACFVVAYITHPPALILLGFGILTFLTMQIQLSGVHAIRNRSTEQANSAIAGQTQSLGEAINQAMLAQSQEYAIEMNTIMRGWQEDIDTTIFGPWLNTTTVTLNNTLVGFYDKVESGKWRVLVSPRITNIQELKHIEFSLGCYIREYSPRQLGQRLRLLYPRVQDRHSAKRSDVDVGARPSRSSTTSPRRPATFRLIDERDCSTHFCCRSRLIYRRWR